MKKHSFYVVLQRWMKEKDCISIFDYAEAVRNNWIKEDGERIWVVPPKDEFTTTFVWGFDGLDKAMTFFECLQQNELGIECKEG